MVHIDLGSLLRFVTLLMWVFLQITAVASGLHILALGFVDSVLFSFLSFFCSFFLSFFLAFLTPETSASLPQISVCSSQHAEGFLRMTPRRLCGFSGWLLCTKFSPVLSSWLCRPAET